MKVIGGTRTNLALKARTEIADLLRQGKTERARIRVESVIREDCFVEALDLVEM